MFIIYSYFFPNSHLHFPWTYPDSITQSLDSNDITSSSTVSLCILEIEFVSLKDNPAESDISLTPGPKGTSVSWKEDLSDKSELFEESI
jgi:hypothetical protein